MSKLQKQLPTILQKNFKMLIPEVLPAVAETLDL
jgi:hypothetical protein